MDPHDHVPILDRCLQRVTRWRLPPKWSRRDWLEEAEAAGQLAACKAEQDYDPASGIDHEAFVYQRVMAGILSRYRTEWVYGMHCSADVESRDVARDAERGGNGVPDMDKLLAALDAEPRQLLEQYFRQDYTEEQIAADLGVSQPTASRRITSALGELRCIMIKLGFDAPPQKKLTPSATKTQYTRPNQKKIRAGR